MKFKIRQNILKNEDVLEFFLEYVRNDIVLMVSTADGDLFNVLKITQRGTLQLASHVSDNIGLDINKKGYINIDDITF